MGRSGLGAGLAIAALAISGCGSASTPNATTSGHVTAPTSGPTSSTATSRVDGGGPQSVDSPDDGSLSPPSPAFPLTISRTGGIAAFNDTITLRADGRLSVETRSLHARTCTLDRQRQLDLVAALGTLHLGGTGATGVPDPAADGSEDISGTGGTGSPSGAGGDTSQIVIAVVDARGRSVDLGEPSLASVLTMVTSLVSDVTLSQPSTQCTTGSAAPAGR
ncbi:MAG: hypothetical protein L0H96_11625 [Humibacillus sp.]|nr:hypothetical protein [Humibacillus sp.]MDN5777553.1 hypothetical protein [Humibacillus sp.]